MTDDGADAPRSRSGASGDKRATTLVADALRDGIARGRYVAGERIYQDEIAEALKVSRQPVRQALSELKAEGLLVETKPGRLIVRKVSSSELEDLFSLRMILEPEAARLAALRIEPQDLEKLRVLNRRMKEEPRSIVEANYEFHHSIAMASGSPLLTQFISRLLRAMPADQLSLTIREESAHRAGDEHDVLIEALARGDSETARDAMADHLKGTRIFRQRWVGQD